MRITEAEAKRSVKEIWGGLSPGEKKPVGTKYAYDCPLCEWVVEGGWGFETGQTVDVELRCTAFQRICPLIKKYGKSCVQLGYGEDTKSGSQAFIDAVMGL